MYSYVQVFSRYVLPPAPPAARWPPPFETAFDGTCLYYVPVYIRSLLVRIMLHKKLPTSCVGSLSLLHRSVHYSVLLPLSVRGPIDSRHRGLVNFVPNIALKTLNMVLKLSVKVISAAETSLSQTTIGRCGSSSHVVHHRPPTDLFGQSIFCPSTVPWFEQSRNERPLPPGPFRKGPCLSASTVTSKLHSTSRCYL